MWFPGDKRTIHRSNWCNARADTPVFLLLVDNDSDIDVDNHRFFFTIAMLFLSFSILEYGTRTETTGWIAAIVVCVCVCVCVRVWFCVTPSCLLCYGKQCFGSIRFGSICFALRNVFTDTMLSKDDRWSWIITEWVLLFVTINSNYWLM